MNPRDASSHLGALALYSILTILSFPHELPNHSSLDLGSFLAWFVPATLIIGIEGIPPARAARVAFLASLAGHAILFHWFFVVTVVHGGMPAWLGTLAPLVPAIWVSLFTALFAWLWSQIGPATRAPVLVGALLWVSVDWIRGHLLGGFPWATLGYALHLDESLMSWTRWTGVHGLSFVAAVGGLGIGVAWCDRMHGRPGSSRIARAVGFVVVAHLLGAMIPPVEFPSAETVRIAAIQGNIDQTEKWDAARRDRILETYLRLSERAVGAGAEWIVWPETAVPGLIEVDSALRERITAFARRSGRVLVIGGTGVEVDPVARRFTAFYDSAFLVDARGVVRDRYDKTQLVPFGEFVPLRGLLGRFFQALARGLSTTDIAPGRAPRVFVVESPDGSGTPLRVGTPICYELLFPHVVRHFADQGAGVMLAMTNDAWYGRTGAPHQFLAMSAIRSAENGRWMVRAANTGFSAIVDSGGRVRERSALFEEAVVVADVPVATSTPPTFYARHGDVFAGTCLFAAIALFGRTKLGQRRRTKESELPEGRQDRREEDER
ncbi:MAG TPA: apolipoprotein N-acyltransferase [Deltaproteobacteria bacterium]|nr:apolipoprotein N-acyltransferase [Deltaproteobacteria bacterium]